VDTPLTTNQVFPSNCLNCKDYFSPVRVLSETPQLGIALVSTPYLTPSLEELCGSGSSLACYPSLKWASLEASMFLPGWNTDLGAVQGNDARGLLLPQGGDLPLRL